MLSPTVTWGELKKAYAHSLQTGISTPDNLLAEDMDLLRVALEKKDDEYFNPAAAERYLKAGKEGADPEPVTAAGEPAPEEDLDPDLPSPLYYTVDDDGMVLELVKADDEGLFIRLDGKWVDISDEDEFPTVYEKDMHFANDQSVSVWDSEMEDNDDLRLEDIEDYIIK